MRLLLAFCSLLSAASASAVILHGGSDMEAPDCIAYVGKVHDASGVFLGEHNGAYWVLAAEHVTGNQTYSFFDFNGTEYQAVDGSGRRIGSSDLFLYQINVESGSALSQLAPLTLSTGSYEGASVVMAGHGGIEQDTTLSTWGSNSGYYFTPGQGELTWGVSSAAKPSEKSGLGADIMVSPFSNSVTRSARGALGDSGGGVFALVEGEWTLLGIMVTVLNFEGSPANMAVFGEATAWVDLGLYADALATEMIPEPGVYGMLGVVTAAGWLWSRRRMRANQGDTE